MISPYHLFFYEQHKDIESFNDKLPSIYDFFLSAYTEEDIVTETYSKINATEKYWIICPEYSIDKTKIPNDYFDYKIQNQDNREAEYMLALFKEKLEDKKDLNICIDATGFMKPYIIFLLILLKEKGFKKIDLIYTEPQSYEKNGATEFSDKESVINVRNIKTFDSYYQKSNSDDLYIINAGYTSKFVNKVLANIKVKEKKVLVGFPSLQPIMYQENIINLEKSNGYLGLDPTDDLLYAPANNPFITAHIVSKYIKNYRQENNNISNIYLSPLATKAQTIGLTLFYLFEKDIYAEEDISIHIRYPFTDSYSSKAGIGYFCINKYTIEFDLFDKIKE